MKLVILLVSAAAIACAKTPAGIPQETVNHASTRDSRLSSVYTDGRCHIRLKAVPGQGYADKGYMFYANGADNPVGWGFGFDCHAGASQEQIDVLLDAKEIDGQWVWYNPGVGNVSENPPFTPEQHFHHETFSGKNWKGTAITYDDTTGDEATRGRNLFFCLVETGGPQVLCGGPISVRALVDPPSASALPKIMTVLKTIEFVDPPTVPTQPTSTAASH